MADLLFGGREAPSGGSAMVENLSSSSFSLDMNASLSMASRGLSELWRTGLQSAENASKALDNLHETRLSRAAPAMQLKVQ